MWNHVSVYFAYMCFKEISSQSPSSSGQVTITTAAVEEVSLVGSLAAQPEEKREEFVFAVPLGWGP